MTRETGLFLLALLDGQQLNVGAPDFAQTVAHVLTARAELLALVAEPMPT
jgi:hypothetical protein